MKSLAEHKCFIVQWIASQEPFSQLRTCRGPQSYEMFQSTALEIEIQIYVANNSLGVKDTSAVYISFLLQVYIVGRRLTKHKEYKDGQICKMYV